MSDVSNGKFKSFYLEGFVERLLLGGFSSDCGPPTPQELMEYQRFSFVKFRLSPFPRTHFSTIAALFCHFAD